MDLTPLCACRLFQDLPEEFLRQEILPRGTLRAFEKQAVLLSPGDQVDWFAVLLRGRVQITQLFSDGTSSLMDALGPAYVLGADLACTRSRRAPYFAIAVTAAQPAQALPSGHSLPAGNPGPGSGLPHHAGRAPGNQPLSGALLPGGNGGVYQRQPQRIVPCAEPD